MVLYRIHMKGEATGRICDMMGVNPAVTMERLRKQSSRSLLEPAVIFTSEIWMCCGSFQGVEMHAFFVVQ